MWRSWGRSSRFSGGGNLNRSSISSPCPATAVEAVFTDLRLPQRENFYLNNLYFENDAIIIFDYANVFDCIPFF